MEKMLVHYFAIISFASVSMRVKSRQNEQEKSKFIFSRFESCRVIRFGCYFTIALQAGCIIKIFIIPSKFGSNILCFSHLI